VAATEKRSGTVRKATALSYEPGADKAPKVVASGRGDIAEKIIETAREADVPVYEDAHLADVLGALKLGTEIPQELYEVVAEVLAFVSRMDEQALATRRLSRKMQDVPQQDRMSRPGPRLADRREGPR
jgi:flagellar biosynthesis protein